MTIPKPDEEWQWTVDVNDDDSGVIVSFENLTNEGVEQFVTAMCPHSALEFASAITQIANGMLGIE